MEKENVKTLPMEALAELICLQTENGGTATLTVTGSSMMPMLHHQRDAVMLIQKAARQKKGDIILYKLGNGRYVLHRIIALKEDGYICCGDNQTLREQVSHSQVLAVVSGFHRKGKHYTVDAPGYRLYTALWVDLFFLRRPYIKLRRSLGRLRKRMRKK